MAYYDVIDIVIKPPFMESQLEIRYITMNNALHCEMWETGYPICNDVLPYSFTGWFVSKLRAKSHNIENYHFLHNYKQFVNITLQ